MALIRLTPAKLAANRANAKLSRGPVTPEGKARSSQNATTWGFTAAMHGMPNDWHRAAILKANEISSDFPDPTERYLIAHHVYLLIWRRYLGHLTAQALNEFPDPLAWINHPSLWKSINRACARVDHMARNTELSLARYRKNKSATTIPYLVDSTTPLVRRAAAAPSSDNRERQRAGGPATVRERSAAPERPEAKSATTIPYLPDSTQKPHAFDTS